MAASFGLPAPAFWQDPSGEPANPLKTPRVRADDRRMDVWFHHLADFFWHSTPEGDSVRKLLEGAARRSAPVGFSALDAETCPKTDHGAIESVDDDAITILTPRSGGNRLIVGEHLLLYINAGSGFDVGEVEVLGEWEHHDGMIHRSGVRVSIPAVLEHVQRREHHRLPVAFDLSPRATLQAAGTAEALGKGEVLDISESGARVRISLAREVSPGEQIKLSALFPKPFPSFEVLGEIVHLMRSEDNAAILGIRFLKGIPDLGRAIHQLELRRAQRLRK